MAATETEIVQGIGSDYAIKYGFSVPEDNIYYYIKPTEKQASSWEDLPPDIKDTWDKLGIPEAEKKYLAGVGAQYESEVVYHKLQEQLTSQGVIFLDTDTALREHEDLFKQYFGTIVPQNDNKFAALNSAVWSGGSFIYVPPGVKIELPLQAYFRINAANMGQFERTLIIVDEGAYVHYVEGCTAPIYTTDSLHSAVVEIIVKEGGRCRYTTIQNWSTNVYNLVTKRAVAYKDATMEWVDGNLGSKITVKYPAIWLMGERAHGEVLSIVCDALILDEKSRSDTYPYIKIEEDEVDIGHEATVSKIGEEQLFYLMSRGLSEAEATAMIVSGFVEPITKELPLEYALGNVTLALVSPEAMGPDFRAEGHQMPIGLRVPDVAVAREKLEAEGVEFAHETIDSGVCLLATFSDPDGNRLQLHRRYAPFRDGRLP